MANKEYRDERGTYVWRTVGGRHIKIYTGQTLAEAMKESGKFKMRKDVADNVEFKDMKEDTIKRKGVTAKEYQRAEGNVEQLRKEYETLLREEEDYQKDWDMSKDPSFELESVAYDRSQKEEELQEARKKYDDLMKKDGFIERKFQMPINKEQQSSGTVNEGTVSFEKENKRFQKQLEKNDEFKDIEGTHQSLGIEHTNSEFFEMLSENGYNDARIAIKEANLNQEEMDYIKAKNKLQRYSNDYPMSINNNERYTDLDDNVDILIEQAKKYSNASIDEKLKMINGEIYLAKNDKSIYANKEEYLDDMIEWQLADKSQKYWEKQKRKLKSSIDDSRDRKLLEKIGITSKERQDEILADREGRTKRYAKDVRSKTIDQYIEDHNKKVEQRDNKYATNNGSGSDDNTSAYADKALDYWRKQREDTLARGGDTAWEDDSIRRWEKEKENRLYGEKRTYKNKSSYEGTEEYTGDVSDLKARHTKQGVANYINEANDKIRAIITGKSRADKSLEKYGLRVERDNSAQKQFGKRYFGKNVEVIDDRTGKKIYSSYDNYFPSDDVANAKHTSDTKGIQWHTIKNKFSYQREKNKDVRDKFNYYDYLKKPYNQAKNEGDTLGQKVAQYKQDKKYLKQHEYEIKTATKTAERYLKTKNELDDYNLRKKYQGTYEYLKNTTNMSGAEILEYLKKIKD